MIRALSRLLRPRLALLNAVTAVGGYLLYPAEVAVLPLSALFCGVVLLAAGGSAINQVLEQDLDRLMVRTRTRPLPQGQLSPGAASLIGAGTIMAGLALLGVFGGLTTALFGCATLMWYLCVYTPLKRHTSYALLVGAICGALSPVIGWSLAGGHFIDYRIVLLSGVLYLWQIPHFWLFQRRYAADYRAAGFPLLAAVTRDAGFPGLFGIWIAALATASMLMPAFGLISHGSAVCCALFPLPLIAMTLLRSERAIFSYLNLFPLLVTLALFLNNNSVL
jgi:protoheme IX farnesyltransferase